MKKLCKGLLVLALCVSTQIANAANIKDYPRVAVMNFGNKAITSRGLREHDFSSASEYAIFQLSNCGWFDLVDYEQLSTIAKMHSVNMSGLVDPSTAVAVGKFAGAEFMVIGNVTGLTTKENVFGYQHGNKGGIDNAQHVVTANVAVRIVDIETGRIVAAGLGKGSSTSTHTELSFKKYRNRKIETEDISDTITTDIVDEYTQNRKTSNNTSGSSTINKDNTKNDTKVSKENNTVTDVDSSTTSIERENTSTESEIDKSGSSTSENNTTGSSRDTGKELVDGSSDEVVNQMGLMTTNETISSNTNIEKVETQSTEKEKDKTNTESVKENLSSEKGRTVVTEKGLEETYSEGEEISESSQTSFENKNETDETVNKANNQNRVQSTNKSISYERESEDYVVTIGTVEVSDIQVRNAISKAVRDAIYGNTGIMTVLNGGKKLKIKTGF